MRLDSCEEADRATNSTKPDISRLYIEWQKKELGADNGKPLFDRLGLEISSYNDEHSSSGGRAKFQCYQSSERLYDESGTSDDDDSNRRN